MLRKFCETVNIMLDTSQLFGIISHRSSTPFEKVPVKRDAVLFFYRSRVALSHPQNAPPGSSGSALSDDSQFFATALYLPEPAGKFAPLIFID